MLTWIFIDQYRRDALGDVTRILTNMSVPSVIFADASWYGSLRGGVEVGGGNDASFKDGGSRWGIKGSSEISEGLSAIYRFEHKISTTDASQPGGRLAYAGLSGSFGTVSLGQIWSASFNHVGGITDGSWFYGNSETSYRVGNALSYAMSAGAISMQLDAVMDGGTDTGESVDQLEFGMTVSLGDIGKLGLAYVDTKDSMVTNSVFMEGTPTMVSVTDGMANTPTMVGVTPGSASTPTMVGVTPGSANTPTMVGVTPGSSSTPTGVNVTPGSSSTPTGVNVTPGSQNTPTMVDVDDGVIGQSTMVDVDDGSEGTPSSVQTVDNVVATNYRFTVAADGSLVVASYTDSKGNKQMVTTKDQRDALKIVYDSDALEYSTYIAVGNDGSVTNDGAPEAEPTKETASNFAKRMLTPVAYLASTEVTTSANGLFELAADADENADNFNSGFKKIGSLYVHNTCLDEDGALDSDATGCDESQTLYMASYTQSGGAPTTNIDGQTVAAERVKHATFVNVAPVNNNVLVVMTDGTRVEGTKVEPVPGTATTPTEVDVATGRPTKPTEVDVTPGAPNNPTVVNVTPGSGGMPTDVNVTPGEGGTPTEVNVTPGEGGTPTEVNVTPGEGGTPTEVDVTPGEAGTPTMVAVTPGEASHYDDVTSTVKGSRATHVAAQFSLGAITAYLGYSQKEENGSGMKDKTTHYGISGGLGETGISFHAMARNKDNASGMDSNPWLVGLTKGLGGGATVMVEHGNADNGTSGKTRFGLKVDF